MLIHYSTSDEMIQLLGRVNIQFSSANIGCGIFVICQVNFQML